MPGTRIAILLNFIAPYRVPLLRELAKQVDELKIFVSTPMEPNRQWSADWQDLNVCVQKNITLQRTWKHPSGFEDTLYVHIPYDTFPQLGKYKPDVIISHELGMRSVQAVLFRLFHRKSRLILWCMISDHTEQGRGRLREMIRHWLLPQADAILINGEGGARYVRRFNIPENKMFRVPYTPETSLFASGDLNRPHHPAIRLLAVSQLIPRKGLAPFLDVLVEWARSRPERSVEFRCAGNGPLHDPLAARPFPPNLKFTLLGNIEYSDLPTIYYEADILAFPTLADEWGLVVNEAMAAGLPVLGSRYSQAVEELVKDGVTGWTFRPDHADEMMKAIDRALSTSPTNLQRMGAAAREEAIKITPESVSDQILNAIKFVIA
jgi:glycosyltransferase involved in cell wall biosynthesis